MVGWGGLLGAFSRLFCPFSYVLFGPASPGVGRPWPSFGGLGFLFPGSLFRVPGRVALWRRRALRALLAL
jgi:hypothetical protein